MARAKVMTKADQRIEQVLGLMRDRFATQGWVSLSAIQEAAMGLRPVIEAHHVDGALQSLVAMERVERRAVALSPGLAAGNYRATKGLYRLM